MIVIADTSPLNYLVLIGEVDILRLLYQRVVIPEGVLRELQHPETPAAVSEWIARRPGWLEVKGATVVSDPVLRLLGEGESEAITLAQQHRPDVLLLMDEGKERREAQRRNLRVTGTLGILNDAASLGWVNLPAAIERLRQTTFRASPSLLQSFLEREAKRKREG